MPHPFFRNLVPWFLISCNYWCRQRIKKSSSDAYQLRLGQNEGYSAESTGIRIAGCCYFACWLVRLVCAYI